MRCNIEIIGNEQPETTIRPISSQTEPISELILTITTVHTRIGVPSIGVPSTVASSIGVPSTGVPSTGVPTHDSKHNLRGQNVLWRHEIYSRRRVKLNTLCEYLTCKIEHCRMNASYVRDDHMRSVLSYRVKLRCNVEWLISVIETEMDYHLGKKSCTKKYNEKYMQEYMATQLSGFGEKFYDPDNNISRSVIAQVYKLKLANDAVSEGKK